ncbi:hypothetical protein VCR5J5_690009 [Vibrio crassostreae]|uniref:Uncharacterized protein n=1 Tax=Vibrio crassostreae TaxID=246167 RepID=A0A822N612_9VIBR|nr:hypothetical protein VCR9J2_1600010 [Vibrio crassostreae]CDT53990.1 hypothetical protein VCR5J5_690009 [Vibrio crassostreae]
MFNERPIVQNQIGLIAFLAGGLSREYFLEGIFGCLQGDHEDESIGSGRRVGCFR